MVINMFGKLEDDFNHIGYLASAALHIDDELNEERHAIIMSIISQTKQSIKACNMYEVRFNEGLED